MATYLKPGQLAAIRKLHTGSILCGTTGSGKSITSLAYYYILNGGSLSFLKGGEYTKMKNPVPLYIITTAQKRDKKEWEMEMARFLMNATVDSWNNIAKYADVKNAFFIFDEQRVVGYGKWSKTFIKISKSNNWILLSATPGDTYSDYLPVFIANGYFRNKTDFNNQHVVFKPYSKFPQIEKYIYTNELDKYISEMLVDLPVDKKTIQHHNYILTDYNEQLVKDVTKTLINPETEEPFLSSSEYCYWVRKVLNSDPDRIESIKNLLKEKRVLKAIIFYNFDYELELLRTLSEVGYTITEWNGHHHMPIAENGMWLHLVQYNAGAEGWNCIKTDTMIFYSENYSYKMMFQAAGRIDRLNTPYEHLFYYHFRTKANLDKKIANAIVHKRKFNENNFISIRKPDK